MKKKLMAVIAALFMAATANAQFEAEKLYIGGSLSGLGLKYSGNEELTLGVGAQLGYFFADNLMLYGQAGYQHDTNGNNFTIGAGGRYYIVQNGIYLGANCKYVHYNGGYNDVMPGVEVGYAFFLSHTVTVEPAIYYDQSLKDHSEYSTVGLRLGIGVYLFKD